MPTLPKTATASGGTATATSTKPANAAATVPRTNGSNTAGVATMTRPNGTANTATMARPSVGSNSQVLQFIDELNATIMQLQRAMESYADAAAMARDQILLRSYFDQIVGRTWQIAQACKIPWTPPQVNVSRGR